LSSKRRKSVNELANLNARADIDRCFVRLIPYASAYTSAIISALKLSTPTRLSNDQMGRRLDD